MKKKALPLVCLLLLTIAALACGQSSALKPVQPAPEVQVTSAPSGGSQATAALPPTNIPEPSPTPEPTKPVYVDPVILGDIKGTGKTVTDNIKLPACNKTVFQWKVAPSSYGAASLILQMYQKGSDKETNLVNDMVMETSADGMSGSVLQQLTDGEYYFASDNTTEPWSLHIECQDGVAPVANGIDIGGLGNQVSANYELPACQKSVFHWQVEPGQLGAAALILDLCGAECRNIANEMEMDLTEPMTGDSLQSVDAGNYFLTTQNANGNKWRITWECKD